MKNADEFEVIPFMTSSVKIVPLKSVVDILT